MDSEAVECQTNVGWYPKKMTASIQITVSGLKSLVEFQSTKSFYFSSTSSPKVKTGESAPEWRLDLSFNGTTQWKAGVNRNESTAVRVTDGGFTATLPSKTIEKECSKTRCHSGTGPICNMPEWVAIPDEDFVIFFWVTYFQPFENDGVIYCKLPADQRLLSKASAAYEDLFLQGADSDVTFVIGDEKIPAHKVILAARVPYFSKMMTSGMIEVQTNQIKIEDADAESFKRLLQYVYCGKLPDDLECSAPKLLPLADKYNLPDLKDACVHWMEKGLAKENVCETLVAADLYHCADLKKKCLESLSLWRSTMDSEVLGVLADFPQLLVELVQMR